VTVPADPLSRNGSQLGSRPRGSVTWSPNRPTPIAEPAIKLAEKAEQIAKEQDEKAEHTEK
jgi:hypothetical protein